MPTVTAGTLVNTGTITASSAGTGGRRTLTAQLDNQAAGTLTVNQPLTINDASVSTTNEGAINLIGAGLTITQSGTGAGFTDSGTITVPATQTLSVSGGQFNVNGGTIVGAGTFALSGVTVNLTTSLTNSGMSYAINSSTVNGPGTLINSANQPLATGSSNGIGLLVAGFGSNNVVAYNPASGQPDLTFANSSSSLSEPVGMVYGPDGNLYVSGLANGAVLRFNGTTGLAMGPFTSGATIASPVGLTFGPDGNLYVGSQASNSVLQFDGHTGAFLKTFVTSGSGGLNGLNRIVFGPDGNLYATSGGSDSVLEYSGTTGAFPP